MQQLAQNSTFTQFSIVELYLFMAYMHYFSHICIAYTLACLFENTGRRYMQPGATNIFLTSSNWLVNKTEKN